LANRKADADERLTREFAGVGFVTVGLLVLASLVLSAQGSPGYVPDAIARLLYSVVGSGAYIVAVILLVLGIASIAGRLQVLNTRLLSGAGLFFACFLVARHAGVPEGHEFDGGAITHGGGLIGATLWWVASRTLGHVCTWIVLSGALLVASVLVTQGHVAKTSMAISKGAVAGGRWVWGRMRAGATAANHRAKAARKPKVVDDTAPLAAPAGEKPLDLTVEPTITDNTLPPEPEVVGEPVPELANAPESEPKAVAEPLASEPPQVSVPPEFAMAGSGMPAVHDPPLAPPKKRHAANKKPESETQLSLIDETELYEPPQLSLFRRMENVEESKEDRQAAEASIALLEDTLDSFGITAKVRHYVRGPSVTRYEVEPVRGIRVNRITRLADDLALAFAAIGVRVEAPIPGKSLIGIEVANPEVAMVGLRSILASQAYREAKGLLTMCIGKDIAGMAVVANLARMPHLLIAGATNSGKTICLHGIIASFLMRCRPDQLRLIMIDPKRVELTMYDGIPHLMAPVVQTAPQAADVLRKVIREMEHRYDMFAMKSVVNIDEYNDLFDMLEDDDPEHFDRMPYIVVIIDELADLMMQAKAEFEFSICRLAQLARATGIHLIVATQRPSVNVITGTIKANIPSRIALTVASIHDSRTIIDGQGAERLIGRGDMLFLPFDANKPRRVQGAFVERRDLEKLVDHLREQGEPNYEIIPEVKEEMAGYSGDSDPSDDLYEAAVELVVGAQEASVSMLQRRFKIGYARAGRLVDMMAQRDIIGPSEGSKPRKVLVPPNYLEQQMLESRRAELGVGRPDPGSYDAIFEDGPSEDAEDIVAVVDDLEEA